MPFTFTELLDDIKIRGMVPTSQSTFTVARFLTLVNDEMQLRLAADCLRVRQNHFAYDVDYAINATGVYDIHTRSIASRIQNACLTDGTSRHDLDLLDEDALTSYAKTPTGNPGLVIKRNQLILIPADGQGWPTLRVTIYIGPATVVETTSAAQITAIDTAAKKLSFALGTIPSSWGTSNLFDMVQQKPHFDTLAIDQVITAIDSTSMTFASALSSRLAVGDWVSLAGESPVIQAPRILHPILAQRVANICLSALTDPGALKLGEKTLTDMEKAAGILLSPRIEKEGKKLVNRTGILRRF